MAVGGCTLATALFCKGFQFFVVFFLVQIARTIRPPKRNSNPIKNDLSRMCAITSRKQTLRTALGRWPIAPDKQRCYSETTYTRFWGALWRCISSAGPFWLRAWATHLVPERCLIRPRLGTVLFLYILLLVFMCEFWKCDFIRHMRSDACFL